jgi:hypothetical protein
VNPDGSGLGPVTGCCEYGDEPSCSGVTDLVLEECAALGNGVMKQQQCSR